MNLFGLYVLYVHTKTTYRSKRSVGHLRCYNSVVNGKFARFWKRSSRNTPCMCKSKRNKMISGSTTDVRRAGDLSRRCATGTVWRIISKVMVGLHEVANGTTESKSKIKGLPSRCHLPVEERTPQAQWGRRDMTRYKCKKWKAHAIPREAE